MTDNVDVSLKASWEPGWILGGLRGRLEESAVQVRVVLYTNTPRIVDTIGRHPLKIFDN